MERQPRTYGTTKMCSLSLKVFTNGAASVVLTITFIYYSTCYAAYLGDGPNELVEEGRRNLDLIKVLNTTDPIFLYMWKRNNTEKCVGSDCLNQTKTCDHMREISLSNTYYVCRWSTLTGPDTWYNESRVGKFEEHQGPPVAMDLPRFIEEQRVHERMELKFNQPGTYNCSVFVVTDMRNKNEGNVTCALYMRGKLKLRQYPPTACQIDFYQRCTSRMVYQPYSPDCEVKPYFDV
ncbi:uncharacterized protein LOC125759680 [Rhipicephalus sanguineus]|uniref:uncharacterized protein LOC125759680 n=1 Tax=Rhipicephalus sanguineus TaxID=34632 RepID=UPI0020C4C8AE|nr:uncharacterized protein LOC125759680 [Rhipicephalus sanguineus]